MKHFKNSELTRLYSVSDKAVRNWIELARLGKSKLRLVEQNGRLYIADTIQNATIIEDLVTQGRKYRNGKSHRKIEPTHTFYDLFSVKQIIDIANNLEKYYEIPFSYRYISEGGKYWASYLDKLAGSPKQNPLHAARSLLAQDKSNIAKFISQSSLVNIIDLGVGNGMAAEGLVGEVIQIGKRCSYIGIDISPELLGIAKQNLNNIYGDKVVVRNHVRDLHHTSLQDVTISTEAPSTIANIFLLLGGVIGNFRQPEQILQNIRDSMRKEDLLLLTDKLDSPDARRFFDFSTDADYGELSFHSRYILDLLGITEDLYEVEQFFDPARSSRFIQVRLKVSLTLHFKTPQLNRIITLEKGNAILLLRVWEWGPRRLCDMLEQSGFWIQRTSLTDNQEYMLIAAKPARNTEWFATNSEKSSGV